MNPSRLIPRARPLWALALLLCAATAGAQTIQLQHATGGGAISQAADVRLEGAVLAWGIPTGWSPAGKPALSTSSSHRMNDGFYAVLVFVVLNGRNAAAPAWLDYAQDWRARHGSLLTAWLGASRNG